MPYSFNADDITAVRQSDGSYASSVVQGLQIPKHDYVSFDPAAAPSTGTQDVVFKVGGAAGATVATLTLTYSSGNLSSVAKV